MKKITVFCVVLLAFGVAFAQSNANDTQAAIVNSLLIQQMMQMQQQQMQQNNQQLQQQTQPQQVPPQQPVTQQETKASKKTIETDEDLLEAGYKRFKIDEDAEDYIVFKNAGATDYEIDVWAVNNRNRLSYHGTILVSGKKGFKGNPLDDGLDNYKAVWFKVTNDERAIIKNLGEKHSDQYFEMQ